MIILDTQIIVKIEKEIKEKFQEKCEQNRTRPSIEIRKFIEKYIKER